MTFGEPFLRVSYCLISLSLSFHINYDPKRRGLSSVCVCVCVERRVCVSVCVCVCVCTVLKSSNGGRTMEGGG